MTQPRMLDKSTGISLGLICLILVLGGGVYARFEMVDSQLRELIHTNSERLTAVEQRIEGQREIYQLLCERLGRIEAKLDQLQASRRGSAGNAGDLGSDRP